MPIKKLILNQIKSYFKMKTKIEFIQAIQKRINKTTLSKLIKQKIRTVIKQ